MAYGITNEIKHDAGLSPMIANDRPIEWTTRSTIYLFLQWEFRQNTPEVSNGMMSFYEQKDRVSFCPGLLSNLTISSSVLRTEHTF